MSAGTDLRGAGAGDVAVVDAAAPARPWTLALAFAS